MNEGSIINSIIKHRSILQANFSSKTDARNYGGHPDSFKYVAMDLITMVDADLFVGTESSSFGR